MEEIPLAPKVPLGTPNGGVLRYMWLQKAVVIPATSHDHDAVSSRSAIQTLIIDCRVTPSLLASLSSS